MFPPVFIMESGKYNSIEAAFLLMSSGTIFPLGAIVGYLWNIVISGYNNILKFAGQFFISFNNEHLLEYPSASLSKIAIKFALIFEK